MDSCSSKKVLVLVKRIRQLALRLGPSAFRDVANLLGANRPPTNSTATRPMRLVKPSNADPLPLTPTALVVKMAPEEFRIKLETLGIVLSPGDCATLLLAFRDTIGYFVVTDFIACLISTLNERRIAVVQRAFEALCNKKEVIDAEVLRSTYQASTTSSHDNFDSVFSVVNTPGGIVTRQEFVMYYAAVGHPIECDDAFVHLVLESWSLRPKNADEEEGAPNHHLLISRRPIPEFTVDHSRRRTLLTNSHKNIGIDIVVPKRIVGYTGHVPYAQEHFGQTYHQIDALVPDCSFNNKRKGKWRVDTLILEECAMVKGGNKANAHNFSFA